MSGESVSILLSTERRILAAFAEATLDVPSTTLPWSVEAVDLVARIDAHLQCLSRDSRWVYRCFLWILEYLAIGYYRHPFHRFSRMPKARRQQYLAAWHRSPWSPKRLLKRFLASVVLINYYADARVAAACGYQPVFKPPAPRPPLRPDRVVRCGVASPQSPVPSPAVEVLIIGSGAGGAVAAEALARRGHDVAILEEGDLPDHAEFGTDAARFTRRYYRGAGVTATYGWPTILVPMGRVVGGTTVVNSGTCLRVPPHLFDRWREEFGLEAWGREITDRYAGIEAALHVAPVADAVQGPHAKHLAAGARAAGYTVRPLPRNARDCHGSGVCCFGCPTNAKLSMALSYLPAALEQGARLYANAKVRRLHWSGRCVTAVTGEFLDPATGRAIGEFRFRPKVVIVACGAMHTPVLLRHSRVPDAGRHIGRHLTLHPAAKVLAQYDAPVRAWEGVPQGMAVDGLEEAGILMESIFTPPPYVAPGLLLEGAAHREAMERYPYLGASGFLVSDTSEGRLFQLPGGHAVAYYRVRAADLAKFRRGLIALTEMFFASGAHTVYPGLYTRPILTRAEGAASLRSMRIRAKDLDLQAFHPLGTCRMAADSRKGAIDPTGRLFGLDNCYVADGSIFPTSLGVNPQITIMAAAQAIAEGINVRLQGPS